MTDMTPEELAEYATTLILEHARDVEYLSIFEMAEEHAGVDEISDEDAQRVSELISKATVTVQIEAAGDTPAARWMLDTDDDGHWYLVPVDKKDAFEEWVYGPEGGDQPEGVVSVPGNPKNVTFTSPISFGEQVTA